MKVFTKLFVVAACAFLAFSAVSCANNSNGGKGDLSGSNAISTSTREYRYTDASSDLYRMCFTSGSTWEYKRTSGSVTTTQSKGTYSTNGTVVTFTETWILGQTSATTYNTYSGTLSNSDKNLYVKGNTYIRQ